MLRSSLGSPSLPVYPWVFALLPFQTKMLDLLLSTVLFIETGIGTGTCGSVAHCLPWRSCYQSSGDKYLKPQRTGSASITFLHLLIEDWKSLESKGAGSESPGRVSLNTRSKRGYPSKFGVSTYPERLVKRISSVEYCGWYMGWTFR